MGELIFVLILGAFGVWAGIRFARWYKSHIGKRIEKPLPPPSIEWRDESVDPE